MELTEDDKHKLTVIGFLTRHTDIGRHRLLSKYGITNDDFKLYLKNDLCQNTNKTDLEESRITILGWEYIDQNFYNTLINKYSNILKETKKVHDNQYNTLIVLVAGISIIINILMMYFIGYIYHNILFYRCFNITIIFIQLIVLSQVIPDKKEYYQDDLQYIAIKRFCYLSVFSIIIFVICFLISLI